MASFKLSRWGSWEQKPGVQLRVKGSFHFSSMPGFRVSHRVNLSQAFLNDPREKGELEPETDRTLTSQTRSWEILR